MVVLAVRSVTAAVAVDSVLAATADAADSAAAMADNLAEDRVGLPAAPSLPLPDSAAAGSGSDSRIKL